MSLQTNDILGGNFAGKTIGVLKGTTTVDEVKQLFNDTKVSVDILMINSTAEGIEGLVKEKIDALAADQAVLIGLALDSEDPSVFSIAPNSFSYEPLALAVRKNDADFRLIANRVIIRLNKSKQIVEVYDKWFGHFSSIRPSAFESLIYINSIPE
jgi:ABC-type amino acid transport substrate-binding protein